MADFSHGNIWSGSGRNNWILLQVLIPISFSLRPIYLNHPHHVSMIIVFELLVLNLKAVHLEN